MSVVDRFDIHPIARCSVLTTYMSIVESAPDRLASSDADFFVVVRADVATLSREPLLRKRT